MDENIELKFPFGEETADDSPWAVDQEPTDLLALWPADDASPEEPPTRTEILAALSDCLGERFAMLEEAEPPSPEVHWAFAARIAGLEVPVIIWAQRAMPVAAGELENAAAEACRWAIGMETLLDPADPLGGYVVLMRALTRAFPESPAVIDINSTLIHQREQLDETFGEENAENEGDTIEPPADDLWTIHAVQSGSSDGALPPDALLWLHTHGLWRCGLPELEMLEVPVKHADTAAELLNDIAALLLEFPPTAPGEAYAVGDDLLVTFQPWQTAIEWIDPASPGGANDRQEQNGENAHVGTRAVVCDVRGHSSHRPIRTWPQNVIQRLKDDEATIYMTHRATVRRSSMARARWGQFATAFASAHKASLVRNESPRAVFLVKAGFAVDDADEDEDRREHLWFEVLGFEGDQADTTLINQPVALTTMNRGDRVRVSKDDVSDWQVQTGMGHFGPQSIALLWHALDALKNDSTNDGDGAGT